MQWQVSFLFEDWSLKQIYKWSKKRNISNLKSQFCFWPFVQFTSLLFLNLIFEVTSSWSNQPPQRKHPRDQDEQSFQEIVTAVVAPSLLVGIFLVRSYGSTMLFFYLKAIHHKTSQKSEWGWEMVWMPPQNVLDNLLVDEIMIVICPGSLIVWLNIIS